MPDSESTPAPLGAFAAMPGTKIQGHATQGFTSLFFLCGSPIGDRSAPCAFAVASCFLIRSVMGSGCVCGVHKCKNSKKCLSRSSSLLCVVLTCCLVASFFCCLLASHALLLLVAFKKNSLKRTAITTATRDTEPQKPILLAACPMLRAQENLLGTGTSESHASAFQ